MDPGISAIVFLISISFLISLFGSIVGFGGGIFMVPLLITFFHYPLDTAVGSVMVALIPSSIISTIINRKEGNVDFKMGILLEVPTMLGVVFGSLLLSYISANRLEIFFALMVLFLGLTFFIKLGIARKEDVGLFYRLNKLRPRFILKNTKKFVAYRVSVWMVLVFGALAGSLAGLFGIGGGFLKTPIMIKVFRIPPKIAAATALFMIVITAITGTISHYFQSHVHLDTAWPIILGFAGGAFVGQGVNLKIQNKLIENLIGIALILAAVVMMSNFIFNA